MKFLVNISFIVDGNDEMNTPDSLEYFLRKHAYINIYGEERDEHNNQVNDIEVFPEDMNISVYDLKV